MSPIRSPAYGATFEQTSRAPAETPHADGTGVFGRIASVIHGVAGSAAKIIPPALAAWTAFHVAGAFRPEQPKPTTAPSAISRMTEELFLSMKSVLEGSAAAAREINDTILEEHSDLIEINHFFDEQGRLVFSQIIFYEWCGADGRFQVRDWRLLKEQAQIPLRDWRNNRFVAEWRDAKEKDVLRRTTASALRETWTQYDPELKEREILPQEQRNRLRNAPPRPFLPLVVPAERPHAIRLLQVEHDRMGKAETEAVSAPERRPPPSLLHKQDWMRLQLVMGRIVVMHMRPVGNRQCVKTVHEEENVSECFSIEPYKSSSVLLFERTDETKRLSVESGQNGDFTVMQESCGASDVAPLSFEQKQSGGVRLVMGAGEEAKTYEAKSIWHLIITEPQLRHGDFSSLLTFLCPGLDVRKEATAVERKLVESSNRPGVSLREINRIIHNLDSAKYMERSAADRQLRSMGLESLHLLETKEQWMWSREQRTRIESIKNDLTEQLNQFPDSVDRVAEWLRGDRSVWMAMLSREDLEVRTAAMRRLSAMTGQDIDVDPSAPAAAREEQIKLLKRRFR
jgi:hypothetical protein